MTSLHLICGPAGAGKTTYALKLRDEIGAAHFSIDDWMVTLFAQDAPAQADWRWISERIARCEKQIIRTALQLGGRGVPSVLDFGFLRAADRQRVAQEAETAGMGASCTC